MKYNGTSRQSLKQLSINQTGKRMFLKVCCEACSSRVLEAIKVRVGHCQNCPVKTFVLSSHHRKESKADEWYVYLFIYSHSFPPQLFLFFLADLRSVVQKSIPTDPQSLSASDKNCNFPKSGDTCYQGSSLASRMIFKRCHCLNTLSWKQVKYKPTRNCISGILKIQNST